MNIGLRELSDKIDSVPADIIDPALMQQEIALKERLILATTLNKTKVLGELDQNKIKFEKITDFLSTFDITSYQEKRKSIREKRERLENLIEEMSNLSSEKLRHVRKHDLLSEVPCGSQFPSC